mmetsp:Transcript_34037/g.75006  ORF Transcript_34037/g.75006 Transcript_34037/m.75006 type:complete len:220 (+) Transcript_34037:1825-2484(+)
MLVELPLQHKGRALALPRSPQRHSQRRRTHHPVSRGGYGGAGFLLEAPRQRVVHYRARVTRAVCARIHPCAVCTQMGGCGFGDHVSRPSGARTRRAHSATRYWPVLHYPGRNLGDVVDRIDGCAEVKGKNGIELGKRGGLVHALEEARHVLGLRALRGVVPVHATLPLPPLGGLRRLLDQLARGSEQVALVLLQRLAPPRASRHGDLFARHAAQELALL